MRPTKPASVSEADLLEGFEMRPDSTGGRYDDIIGLEHHVSKTREPMSMTDRAAQFSPFAALTGYEGVVAEAARLTDEKVELDGESVEILDGRLRLIADNIEKCPQVTITYFKPDKRKSGGKYLTENCKVKAIDTIGRSLLTDEGLKIPIDDIYGIEGDMF